MFDNVGVTLHPYVYLTLALAATIEARESPPQFAILAQAVGSSCASVAQLFRSVTHSWVGQSDPSVQVF